MGKLDNLKSSLKRIGSVLIAFSGGVDSAFLAAVAGEVLGKKALLVTAVSETYPGTELKDAVKIAKILGLKHKIIRTKEFDDRHFINNPPQRCFFCKKALFSELKKIARKYDIKHIADASNIDDLKDFRPGSKAKKIFGVISPLQKAGFTKKDIRRSSRKMGLPTWNKPACACLASRIPYGEKITAGKLRVIDNAEKILKGFFGEKTNLRVRLHKDIARLELEPRSAKRLFKGDIIKKITANLKRSGISYITLDLEGFRSGSMNEVIRGGKSWQKTKRSKTK